VLAPHVPGADALSLDNTGGEKIHQAVLEKICQNGK
jgi:hypothetical protein